MLEQELDITEKIDYEGWHDWLRRIVSDDYILDEIDLLYWTSEIPKNIYESLMANAEYFLPYHIEQFAYLLYRGYDIDTIISILWTDRMRRELIEEKEVYQWTVVEYIIDDSLSYDKVIEGSKIALSSGIIDVYKEDIDFIDKGKEKGLI